MIEKKVKNHLTITEFMKRANRASTLVVFFAVALALSACNVGDEEIANSNGEQQDAGIDEDGGGTGDSDLEDAGDGEEVDPDDVTVTLTSTPDAYTNQTQASFEFECNFDDCTFECALSSSFAECESPHGYEDLADGQHTFLVRARDAQGQLSPEVVYEWVIDTVAPVVTITSTPEAETNETTAVFEFECDKDNCSFECALDGADFGSCASPHQIDDLPDGDRHFEVRAVDLADNMSDVADWDWNIDTVAPNTTFTDTPPSSSYYPEAYFGFECDKDNCSFECSLNGAAFESCTSPEEVDGLTRDDHEFSVRATDELGNVGDAAVFEWTVTTPNWIEVASGNEHTCGIIDDGTLWCWGNGSAGRMGDSSNEHSRVPKQVGEDDGWEKVSAGAAQTCGIRNGTLWCFGFTVGGESVDDTPLRKMSDFADWTYVTSGAVHNCAIRGTGMLYCWGANNQGQVGDGSTSTVSNPVRIGAFANWSDVSAGYNHTCAVRQSGELYCWGNNRELQVGASSGDQYEEPRRVDSQTSWVSVSGGFNHSCGAQYNPGAMISEDITLCWGTNTYGQLGTGNDTSYHNPQGMGFSGITAAGRSFSCVGGGDGDGVFCTGRNNHGQLGVGESPASSTTIETTNDTHHWHRLSASDTHMCAIREDETLWCWGRNNWGQLGDDTTDVKNFPTEVVWPF